MSWKAVDRYSQDHDEMQRKQGVHFHRTPPAVLQRQLSAYDAAAERKLGENPLFREIAESQRRFAERAVRWHLDTNVDRNIAYQHYFAKSGQKKSAAKKA
jgi:TRAP-type mannitol/chloroaromatic compound transport system substrate-binding protein